MSTQSEHDTPTVPAYTEAATVDKSSENFEPEIGEEGNGGTYHQGANAFPQSQILENGKTEQLLQYIFHYFGGDYLKGILSRDELVAKYDDGLIAILEQALAKGEDIPFMAVDVKESTEKIKGLSCYVLRLYGLLINGQKAVVTIKGIRVFFDILVPDGKAPNTFEAKIRNILSDIIGIYKIEHVKAFPLLGYNANKKPYLRIFTTTTEERKNVMKSICKNKYSTTSDDTSAYYRKVAREYGFSLSGWSMINNYTYNKNSKFCSHAFHVSAKNFHPVEDPTSLNTRFPISAFIQDRTLLVAKYDDGLIAILEQALAKGEDIPFMAVDVKESTEKIKGLSCYVLRLYGLLINGQKAVVTIKGIRVFFDILVPDGKAPNTFEAKIRNILSDIIGIYKIEHVKAFPLLGYNANKKPYLRIFTTTTEERKNVMKSICKNKYSTTSDDTSAYYRKVAREYGFSLSGWSMINNYTYNKNSKFCSHAFHVSAKNFHPVEDPTSLNTRFPISAFIQDRTLNGFCINLKKSKYLKNPKSILGTCIIETHSTRKLARPPRANYKEDNVFMICMTLHWKDDAKALQKTCLVDIEISPDPDRITIICGNQINLLKAFALCLQTFTPDIQLGFNDSDYDWPFIIEKAKNLNILEWIILVIQI
ncbi:hypothetical protein Glove_16g15 [Diversispora epigaea]|uniref:DNA polymerase delta catalytic subunit n=1 Tax=Diversispora epigaea TaxID=1348612 RepID=A0A397JLW4_9GLOM|nr:hypothetical protein Glove_16g15 [Diversispora epigaea]